jgi:hypothetical protein
VHSFAASPPGPNIEEQGEQLSSVTLAAPAVPDPAVACCPVSPPSSSLPQAAIASRAVVVIVASRYRTR